MAAVLYGIGVRLDEAPELLFTLRNVVVDELVATTVRGVTDHLLDRAGRKRNGAVGIAELSDMFGIEKDDAAAAKTSVSRTSTRTTAAKGGSIRLRAPERNPACNPAQNREDIREDIRELRKDRRIPFASGRQDSSKNNREEGDTTGRNGKSGHRIGSRPKKGR